MKLKDIGTQQTAKEQFLLVRGEFFRQPILTNHMHCRVLVFVSRRANKVAKWKIGLNTARFVIDVASIQSNRNISELEYMRKINYGF